MLFHHLGINRENGSETEVHFFETILCADFKTVGRQEVSDEIVAAGQSVYSSITLREEIEVGIVVEHGIHRAAVGPIDPNTIIEGYFPVIDSNLSGRQVVFELQSQRLEALPGLKVQDEFRKERRVFEGIAPHVGEKMILSGRSS